MLECSSSYQFSTWTVSDRYIKVMSQYQLQLYCLWLMTQHSTCSAYVSFIRLIIIGTSMLKEKRIAASGKYRENFGVMHFWASDRVLECPSMACTSMSTIFVNSKNSSNEVRELPCNPWYCIFRSVLRFHPQSHTLDDLIAVIKQKYFRDSTKMGRFDR